MSYNKVILMGNLTRDPDLRFTPAGKAVAKIGIAINEKWKDANGQSKESTCFVDVEAWGKQAEVIAQWFKKGSPIFIDGRLKLDTWQDKNTKQKKSKLGVVLEAFSFVGKSERSNSTPTQSEASEPSGASEPDAPPTEPEDNSVPF